MSDEREDRLRGTQCSVLAEGVAKMYPVLRELGVGNTAGQVLLEAVGYVDLVLAARERDELKAHAGHADYCSAAGQPSRSCHICGAEKWEKLYAEVVKERDELKMRAAEYGRQVGVWAGRAGEAEQRYDELRRTVEELLCSPIEHRWVRRGEWYTTMRITDDLRDRLRKQVEER